MNRIVTLAASAGLALVGGCASVSNAPPSGAGQAREIIVCDLKPEADRVTVLAAANDLAKLPDTLDVAAGFQAAAAEGGARRITFILGFPDEAALRRAKQDPVYARVRNDVLLPNSAGPADAGVRVFDTTLQNYQVAEQFVQENEAAVLQRRTAAIREQNELRQRTK